MTEPNEAGIVAPNTILFTEGEPVDREDEEALDGVGYDDGSSDRNAYKMRDVKNCIKRFPNS